MCIFTHCPVREHGSLISPDTQEPFLSKSICEQRLYQTKLLGKVCCDCIGNPLKANVSPSLVIVSVLYLGTPALALKGAHYRVTFLFPPLCEKLKQFNIMLSFVPSPLPAVLIRCVLGSVFFMFLSNGSIFKDQLINIFRFILDERTVASFPCMAQHGSTCLEPVFFGFPFHKL